MLPSIDGENYRFEPYKSSDKFTVIKIGAERKGHERLDFSKFREIF
jgi:hypothetical protein